MLNRLKHLFSSASESPSASESMPVARGQRDEDEAIDIGLVDIHLSGWLQNDTGELIKGFAIGPQDTVLDIGCGEGGYALFSARQGAEIILADVDAEKLEIAR